MRSRLTLPDHITISNGVLGFLAITYMIDGKYWLSSILIIFCVGLDGLDGALARRMKNEHALGSELDYFADILSFCIAPAILLYTNFFDIRMGRAWEYAPNAGATVVSTMIVIFGILRLGRHMSEGMKYTHFVGAPSPSIALVVVLLTSIFGKNGVYGYHPVPVLLVLFVLSLLMYSKIPYPKLRGKIGISGGIAFLVVTLLGLVWTKISYPTGSILLVMAAIASFGYIVVGPMVVVKNDRKNG